MNEQVTHILLVEDEKAHVELVCRAFEAHRGRFHLSVAGSLAEARACLAEAPPHLIIADLRLPDGLGTGLLPAEGAERTVPLVVMTAQGDETAAVEAMKAGALDYLVKSEEVLADMPRIAERALREWRYITGRQVAEQALRRFSEENAVMAEIGRIVNSSLDIEEVYQRIGSQVGKLVHFDRLTVNIIDRENETAANTYVTGIDIPELPTGRTFPLSESSSGLAARTKKTRLIQSIREEELAELFPSVVTLYRAGLKSFMLVPLISQGEVVAVMSLQSFEVDAYSEDDVRVAELIGAQIAGAIANAQLYARQKDAEERIKASLGEKEVLLKEINHRVKNNLQIISSLLSLQSRDIQDERTLRSFQVSQDRIKAMALVHEKLYQSDGLSRIDFGEYIKSLADDLRSSYGLHSQNVKLKLDVDEIRLGVDTAIPCGVIVNELVSNSLKHAFPGDRSGEIVISFREVDGQYTMTFKDDGVGIPEDLDISRPSSLGLTIVNALTGQLGGAIDISRNGGSEISITFPAKQTKGD